MTNRLTKGWVKFRGTVAGMDSSRQLASGVVLGMLVGLIPKDSLLVYGLIVVLLMSRANLMSATCSAVVFSLIGQWLIPLAHAIGMFVLTLGSLQDTGAMLMQLPIVPWTRMNNSVVMGSMLLGLLIAFPLYRTSEKCFANYGVMAFAWLRKTPVIRWVAGPPKSELNEGQA